MGDNGTLVGQGALVDQPSDAEAAPWLSPDQLRDWRALVAVLTLLPAALDAQLKRDAGLNNFEYHVLASLSDAPTHSVAMSDLAATATGSVSRVSHAVSRLEDAGWVERRSCQEAGRRTAARLTDAGADKIEEAAPGHVREARRLVVDALTAEQFRALGEAARVIIAGLDPQIARALLQRSGRC